MGLGDHGVAESEIIVLTENWRQVLQADAGSILVPVTGELLNTLTPRGLHVNYTRMVWDYCSNVYVSDIMQTFMYFVLFSQLCG